MSHHMARHENDRAMLGNPGRAIIARERPAQTVSKRKLVLVR